MAAQIGTALRVRARPPAVPLSLIHRVRLDDRLNRGALLPVTTVSAGPGSGKTLTLASWLSHRPPGSVAAWLTVNAADNDLATFWFDLLGALTLSGAVAAGGALSELIPAAGFGPGEALRIRVALLALEHPLLLIIDDFHVLTDGAVLESIDQVLALARTPLRLILATRMVPALRLHRLRVNGQLTEIRANDLAFTESESAELFRNSGLTLTRSQLSTLHTRTQGWPAGVRLAALMLDDTDVDVAIARFSGAEQSVAEYLVGEVLDGLTADQRDFLLRTSVVDRLNSPLATVLTGRTDSQRSLERLAAANALVVTLGGQQHNEWFGYHPLLRELLTHRLALEQPDTAKELHLAAARWFGANGEPVMAVSHACAAQDWDQVGRLLVFGAGLLVLTPDGPALAAALRPAAQLAGQRPTWATLFAAALCHYQDRDYPEMRRDIAEAIEHLTDVPADAQPAFRAATGLMEMIYHRLTGSASQLIDTCNVVLEILDGAPLRAIPAGRGFQVLAAGNLGVGQMWSGELSAAEANLASTAKQAHSLGLGLPAINVQAHLAVIHALRGRVRAAHEEALAAKADVERQGWGSEFQALGVYLALGLAHLAWNQLPQAALTIEQGLAAAGASTSDASTHLALGIAALNLAVAGGDADTIAAAADRLTAMLSSMHRPGHLLTRWCTVARAAAQLKLGNPEAALDTLGPPPDEDGFASAVHRCETARAHLKMGDPHLALHALDPLLTMTTPTYLLAAVDARVLAAVAYAEVNRDIAALDNFTAALDLAAPQGLISPFLGDLPHLAQTLERYTHIVGGHPELLSQLSRATRSAEAAPISRNGDFNHLTERELIVLRYLPTMLKAAEIAPDLFVSVNTVKAHIKSIYRKLGAGTRREAVERARAQNLL